MRPLNAATGFKRLGIVVAVAIVAIFGAAALVSVLVPADQVREAVKAQIRAVTGLDPVLRGATSVSLFPSGSVSFADVSLGDEGQDATPALVAERLTARLKFFPLLTGRIEISDVALEQPRVTVVIQSDGQSNWAGLIQSLTRNLGATGKNDGNLPSFSEVRVAGGQIIFRDEAHGIIESLNDLDMSLAWPSISKSFAAIGHFAWRGEAVDASISLNDFVAALSGQRSGLKARFASTQLKFAFDGALASSPTLKIDGTVAADAASLRQTMVWFGQKPPANGFDRFSLKATTNVNGGNIALSGVNLELDGNTAEGVLTFATDGRQTLQGTLASGNLDLTPYVAAIRLLTSNDREWSRSPITLDALTGADLDLRLSAAQVVLGTTKLGRTAMAANVRDGKFTLTVGESKAFGGVIKGSFALGKNEQGSDLRSQMQFLDVDLESAMGDIFGIRRLEGKGSLAFAIEASGPTVLALTRSMNGTASLTSDKGAITGLNVEQLLRRLERRPLSGGGEFRSGRTPYDRLAVSLRIAQGNASVEELKLEGPAVRLGLEGSASIPGRDLDLKGVASLVSSNSAETAFELPFIVQGPWDDPLMLPDPQSLIRRSGAAAPLLDAVRDRRTRDAVRSAIERLTGSSPAPSAAQPAPTR